MSGVDTVATALRESRGVVVLTGAGVSAESGLRTFRGAGGWWRGHDPLRLATPEAFAADPALVSEWYDERRLAALAARPNPGHDALAVLERQVVDAGGRFLLVTQNVDGLHQRAGTAALVELHGNFTVWRDHRSGRRVTPPATPFPSHPQPGPDGGLLRPDVVWFGETLPTAALERADAALAWCELLLVVGTSALVYPAAGLIERAAAEGARCVEVNLEPSAANVHTRLVGPAGEVLPQLVARAFGDGASSSRP
jgi:NAD-dependent deacetylase